MPGGRSSSHGVSHTRAYRSFRSALQRCYDPKHQAYPYYGGRGIHVCARWRDDPAVFFADMGECPVGHTLERDDTSKGYEPDNCRWLPKKLQARNRSNCVYFTIASAKMTLTEAAHHHGIHPRTLETRRLQGDTGDFLFRPTNTSQSRTGSRK